MAYVTWLLPGEGTQFPVRLKTRLRAWWEGYDLSVLKPAAEAPPGAEIDVPPGSESAAAPAPNSGEVLGRDGRPLWCANRIQVAEALWGKDFLSPGGVEHTAYLVKPFGINPSMSILDLSAGLGGVVRTIAREYKAWVTGMEASPLLAGMAMERSEKEKMSKNAPILNYDPDKMELNKRYDGIFAKEAFFTVHEKDRLFDAIAGAIKPGGQFLFTDYCIEDESVLPALQGWLSHEPMEPQLWTAKHYMTKLKQRKLDVRINEDMTSLQRQLILGALANFLNHLKAHALDRETKLIVLDEVELWARRMMAFDQGLRVYRFYCMKH